MSVVAGDDHQAPGDLGFVKQGGKDRYRIAGPSGIELLSLQQVIVDGIDDDADDAAVWRCDLLSDLPREHGITLAAEGRFVEDNRRKAALAVGPQPGVRLESGLLVGPRSLPQPSAEEARPRNLGDRWDGCQPGREH